MDYVHLVALGWSRLVSWPIIASGPIGDDWPAVDRSGSRLLHRLCCLISLAWGEPWQVRLAPQRVSYMPPEVPEPVLIPRVTWPDFEDSAQIGYREEASLPDWLPRAWEKLNNDAFNSTVAPALSLWHEGILLQPEHPSMSMVAYVAAIEQVAGNPGDGILSARRKFWEAVRETSTPEDLLALKKADVYGKRSATSHGSGLYGIELEFGHMLLKPDGPGDPTYDFMFDTLQRMARISRAVLLDRPATGLRGAE